MEAAAITHLLRMEPHTRLDTVSVDIGAQPHITMIMMDYGLTVLLKVKHPLMLNLTMYQVGVATIPLLHTEIHTPLVSVLMRIGVLQQITMIVIGSGHTAP